MRFPLPSRSWGKTAALRAVFPNHSFSFNPSSKWRKTWLSLSLRYRYRILISHGAWEMQHLSQTPTCVMNSPCIFARPGMRKVESSNPIPCTEYVVQYPFRSVSLSSIQTSVPWTGGAGVPQAQSKMRSVHKCVYSTCSKTG